MVGTASREKIIEGESKVEEADTLDGNEGNDYVLRDGSLSMTGNLALNQWAVTEINYLEGAAVDGWNFYLYTGGVGNNTILIYDNNNDQIIASFAEGGDVNVPNGALQQAGTDVALTSRFPIPNSDLSNSTLSVAGNSVGLGGSTTPDLSDFNSASANVDMGENLLTALAGVQGPQGQSLDINSAGDDWVNIGDEQNDYIRIKPMDEVVNILTGTLQQGGDPVTSSSTGTQYDIQKNGTDGTGVINFKT